MFSTLSAGAPIGEQLCSLQAYLLFLLFYFERTDTCSALSSGIPSRSQVIMMKVTVITAAAIYPLPARFQGHENSMQTPTLQIAKLKPYGKQILEPGFEATFF